MSRKAKTITVLESEMGAVERSDLPESTPEPLESPRKPEQPPMAVTAHPLESAPINSKIVVTQDGAYLGLPGDTQLLGKGDPAHRLPVGAKIVKIVGSEGDVGYLTTQLSPAEPSEPAFYDDLLTAIRKFPEDHHPRR